MNVKYKFNGKSVSRIFKKLGIDNEKYTVFDVELEHGKINP
jgi:hypothetical protein